MNHTGPGVDSCDDLTVRLGDEDGGSSRAPSTQGLLAGYRGPDAESTYSATGKSSRRTSMTGLDDIPALGSLDGPALRLVAASEATDLARDTAPIIGTNLLQLSFAAVSRAHSDKGTRVKGPAGFPASRVRAAP